MPRQRKSMQPHPADKRHIRRDNKGRFARDRAQVSQPFGVDLWQHTDQQVPKGPTGNGDAIRSTIPGVLP